MTSIQGSAAFDLTCYSHRIDDWSDDQIWASEVDDEYLADCSWVATANGATKRANDKKISERAYHRRQADDANVRHRQTRCAVQQRIAAAVLRQHQLHFLQTITHFSLYTKMAQITWKKIARHLVRPLWSLLFVRLSWYRAWHPHHAHISISIVLTVDCNLRISELYADFLQLFGNLSYKQTNSQLRETNELL